MQVPGVLFFGHSLFPLFPLPSARLYSYVGPPLQLPSIPAPSQAEVDEWHGRYVRALTELFDASKAEAGEPEAVLEIW